MTWATHTAVSKSSVRGLRSYSPRFLAMVGETLLAGHAQGRFGGTDPRLGSATPEVRIPPKSQAQIAPSFRSNCECGDCRSLDCCACPIPPCPIPLSISCLSISGLRVRWTTATGISFEYGVRCDSHSARYHFPTDLAFTVRSGEHRLGHDDSASDGIVAGGCAS